MFRFNNDAGETRGCIAVHGAASDSRVTSTIPFALKALNVQW